jgi:hypothetical protein
MIVSTQETAGGTRGWNRSPEQGARELPGIYVADEQRRRSARGGRTVSEDTLIAFDSNVLSYFLQANQAGYDPASDPDPMLAVEPVVAFRLFLYMDRAFVVPTVKREAKRIRDALDATSICASSAFTSTRCLSRTRTLSGLGMGRGNLPSITTTKMTAGRLPRLKAAG